MRNRVLGVVAFAALPATAVATSRVPQRGDTVVRVAGRPLYPGLARLIPEVTIGGLDVGPEYQFRSIRNFTAARDGSVWIVHGSGVLSGVIDLYDSTGRHVRRVGRQGGGPGEYRSPSRVAELPDGRMVLRDMQLANRFTLYSAAGLYDTAWTFTRIFAGPTAFGVDTSGTAWVAYTHGMADGVFKAARIRDAVLIDTLRMPTRTSMSVQQQVQAARGPVAMTPPFLPAWRYAWSPHGYYATAWTSNYAVELRIPPRGRGSTSGLWQEGDRVISIRRRVDDVRVSNAERNDRRAHLEARRDASGGQVQGRIPDIPRTKPPISGIQFGDDGRLWVRVAVPSERFTPERRASRDGRPVVPPLAWREPVVFDVFEPDGRYIGRVEVPEYPMCSSSSMRARGDVIWCDGRGEFDVPVVRRYRIDWR